MARASRPDLYGFAFVFAWMVVPVALLPGVVYAADVEPLGELTYPVLLGAALTGLVLAALGTAVAGARVVDEPPVRLFLRILAFYLLTMVPVFGVLGGLMGAWLFWKGSLTADTETKRKYPPRVTRPMAPVLAVAGVAFTVGASWFLGMTPWEILMEMGDD